MGNVLNLNDLAISATQITGQLVDGQIASLSGSKIASGTVAAAYIDAAIARLASPALTGSPTAPTPSIGNQSTAIATTAYVDPAHVFTASKGGQKFGSGLILNWGYISLGDHPGGGFGAQTGGETFYYSYGTSVLGLVACIYDANDTASIILNTSAWSTTGFNYATSEMGALTQDYYIMYLSVGY